MFALAATGQVHGAAPSNWGVVDRFCIECHNTTDWAGSLSLEGLDPAAMTSDAKVWEKAVRKMRTGMMPPPGNPRPAREQLDAFSGEIESRLA